MSILYAITDGELMAGDKLYRAVSAALEGGCRMVQYRDKSNDDQRRRTEALQLLHVCNQFGAKLIINDDVHLAKTVGAHGVHLGQTDGSPLAARALLGPDAIIGVTCHTSLALAQHAIRDSANYVAFGRFYHSHTKPDAPPAPLTLLAEARQQLGATPIVAIGGITLENARHLRAAGADLLAVSRSLFAADDITQRVQAFNQC